MCGDNKNKEKPIAQCRFCDVTFPTKGDLRKHLLNCEKKGMEFRRISEENSFLYCVKNDFPSFSLPFTFLFELLSALIN